MATTVMAQTVVGNSVKRDAGHCDAQNPMIMDDNYRNSHLIQVSESFLEVLGLLESEPEFKFTCIKPSESEEAATDILDIDACLTEKNALALLGPGDAGGEARLDPDAAWVQPSPYRSLLLPTGERAWMRIDDGFVQHQRPFWCEIPHDLPVDADLTPTWEEDVPVSGPLKLLGSVAPAPPIKYRLRNRDVAARHWLSKWESDPHLCGLASDAECTSGSEKDLQQAALPVANSATPDLIEKTWGEKICCVQGRWTSMGESVEKGHLQLGHRRDHLRRARQRHDKEGLEQESTGECQEHQDSIALPHQEG
eukprot:2789154-Amphidinium_carterae.5